MTGAVTGRLDEKLQRELIPRGFIFYGPPGTGKTLFAKAIANQLNATIQVVSGPEVTDMYVGESERKLRELFAEARRNAPAVLVFDEFDSIAAQRSGRDDGGSRAGNAIVAQILTEMDGFRPDVPMLVIGTTNRLDIIDDALLRPSRFQAVADRPAGRGRARQIAESTPHHFQIQRPDTVSEGCDVDRRGHRRASTATRSARSSATPASGSTARTRPSLRRPAAGHLVGRIRHRPRRGPGLGRRRHAEPPAGPRPARRGPDDPTGLQPPTPGPRRCARRGPLPRTSSLTRGADP